MRDYAENGSAWEDRGRDAYLGLEAGLQGLDDSLAASEWLSGDRYGLADISWVVNYHRLTQAQVDLTSWPRFLEWGMRATKRPTFEAAVLNYTH
ncbi:MAG TPA: hypothetical protein EYG46_15315 [Myxococcales bacterium]|nr:hypothetical protein [Myxococcales bacterium]HIM02349.1 hypothetical protein [Myxococcales bacterium]